MPIDTLVDSRCFQSNSIEHMRLEIARKYCDHDLEVLKSDSGLMGKFYTKPLQRMSLNYLSYGAEVAIDAGDFETFYMLEFPISGHVDLNVGDDQYSTSTGQGTLISPGAHVKSVWSADCTQLMLQIDKAALHAYLQKSIMMDVKEDLIFENKIRFDTGPGASLFSYIQFLLEQSLTNEPLLLSSIVREELEDTIFAILLDQFEHNYSDAIKTEYGLILPKHVSRAYKYIKQNADQSLTNEDLANIAGVSVRTLYSGFNKFLGMSPQACLRVYRLEQVKQELAQARGKIQVNEVAQKWGFNHMGRFSKEFRTRYGITPSQYLKRN